METFRLVLFAALTFILFSMWQAWERDYGQPPAVDSSSDAIVDSQPAAVATPSPDTPALPSPATTDGTHDMPASAQTLQQGASIRVRTDLLDVVIDTHGGDIRDARLRAYPVDIDHPDQPFQLLSAEPNHQFIARSGIIGEADAPNHNSEFSFESLDYQLPDGADHLEVPLTWQGEHGVVVRKVFVFQRDSYKVQVRFEVRNDGDQAWTGRPYAQLQRTRPDESKKQNFIYTYTGAVLHSEENRYDKVKFDDMDDAPVNRPEKGGWVAMIQHYFGAAVIPDQSTENYFYAKRLSSGQYAAGIVAPGLAVAPGTSANAALTFFIGPKEQDRLRAAAPSLELLVDYGVLTLLASPLHWLMDQIHRVVNNWGWSIIILTFIVKLAFYRLSAASYKSMANMRKLQPKMQQLKERYADDRGKMNQAVMELYRKEKINPLGGCLPILIQIPVFIALYWVLLESVEFRQAPFIFWIRDMSTFDPYFVLPIIMGITMIVQQKLNPAPLDPVQAKVMMILPIAFTVLFLFFPSGLVLYWVVNNTLSVIQQWVITKRIEQTAAK